MDLRLSIGVVGAHKALSERARWPADQLASFQAAQLHALRQWAYGHSPFYQRFHRGLEQRPLSDLPPLTKATLMDHFDEIVTDPALTATQVRAHVEELSGDATLFDRYRVCRTSGSSGLPGFIVHAPDEWAIVLAATLRANEWMGLGAKTTPDHRLAVITSLTPWHQSGRLNLAFNDRRGSVRNFDASGALDPILEGLNDWQPRSIVTYPSMIKVLAAEQARGRLRIAPRTIALTSEVTGPEVRQIIRDTWHTEPFDRYATTETAVIAADCARHRLHVFDDLLIVESVDERYRPVPRGTLGAKLLVTVLFARTQPLIRYELNDRVMLSPAGCDCGLPLSVIGDIEGREWDVLRLRSTNDDYVAVYPTFFLEQLEVLAVAGWQVIHERDGTLRVLLLRAAPDIDRQAVALSLARALEALGCASPRILVEVTESLVKMPSGKAPMIWTR
jgi:putative adenylate-forming enzyme